MEDLIKRKDAIANIEMLLDDIGDIQDEDELKERKAYNLGVWASLNSIKHHVPSADRPQGEWLDTGKDPDHSHPLTAIWYKCSECGDGTNTKTNYCPNCGAKMKQ